MAARKFSSPSLRSLVTPAIFSRKVANPQSIAGGIMALVSLVLLGASIMFMFFVILGGITGTTPLDKTQFLTADTSSIAGARPVSQWNFFRVCGAGNTDCGRSVPALPFGYAWVGGGSGAPSSLLGYVVLHPRICDTH